MLYFPILLPPPPLLLLFPVSLPVCCMHFITFGSGNFKKQRIYANACLKNECSSLLLCVEEHIEESHSNIFSFLWIRRIVIKNDLWWWNEAKSLLPGNPQNALVTVCIDRRGNRVTTSSLIIK